jgi:hypothetical protein
MWERFACLALESGFFYYRPVRAHPGFNQRTRRPNLKQRDRKGIKEGGFGSSGGESNP